VKYLGVFFLGAMASLALVSWLAFALFAAVGLAVGLWRGRRRYARLRHEAQGCANCGGREAILYLMRGEYLCPPCSWSRTSTS
jgi:hypothetical protein